MTTAKTPVNPLKKQENQPENIQAKIIKIYSSSSNWSAFRIKLNDGKEVSCNGKFVLREGDEVILTGKYELHEKYGKQFKAESFSYNTNLDKDGLATYIAKNKAIAGIGPVKAKKLVELYYENFDEALNDPEEISETLGIKLESVLALREDWNKKKNYSVVFSKLAGLGLTFACINKLLETYGNNIMGILQTAPYTLIGTMVGFGFKKIDAIALKFGIDLKDAGRISACIKYLISENENEGHSWIEPGELIKKANDTLHMNDLNSKDLIIESLDKLIKDGVLRRENGKVSSWKTYNYEADLLNFFTPKPNMFMNTIDEGLFGRAPFSTLNTKQRKAIETFYTTNQLLICGIAGSGKTHVTNCFVNLFESIGVEYILVASTGKAAKRLSEATGRGAATLHRGILKYKGGDYYDYNEGQIKNKVIILDEFGMITIDLMWHLYKACDLDSCCFIFIGDHQQLPPVGLGNILRDILINKYIPTVIFDECVRQSGELKENCLAILNGEVRPTSTSFIGTTERRSWYKINKFKETQEILDFLSELYLKYIPEKLKYNLIKDVQLMSPTNKGPLGVDELNKFLQRKIQKKLYNIDVVSWKNFYKGDKVVQTRNNYDLGVMNGEWGIVESVIDNNALTVRFDDVLVEYKAEHNDAQDLKLAYCSTIHRFQGAQCPFVIGLIHKSHTYQHDRTIIYTLSTRSTQGTMIIGDSWAISNCCKTVKVDNRRTFLKDRLV